MAETGDLLLNLMQLSGATLGLAMAAVALYSLSALPNLGRIRGDVVDGVLKPGTRLIAGLLTFSLMTSMLLVALPARYHCATYHFFVLFALLVVQDFWHHSRPFVRKHEPKRFPYLTVWAYPLVILALPWIASSNLASWPPSLPAANQYAYGVIAGYVMALLNLVSLVQVSFELESLDRQLGVRQELEREERPV